MALTTQSLFIIGRLGRDLGHLAAHLHWKQHPVGFMMFDSSWLVLLDLSRRQKETKNAGTWPKEAPMHMG